MRGAFFPGVFDGPDRRSQSDASSPVSLGWAGERDRVWGGLSGSAS